MADQRANLGAELGVLHAGMGRRKGTTILRPTVVRLLRTRWANTRHRRGLARAWAETYGVGVRTMQDAIHSRMAYATPAYGPKWRDLGGNTRDTSTPA